MPACYIERSAARSLDFTFFHSPCRQPGGHYSDILDSVNHEVQGLGAGQDLYALPPELLFVIAPHGRYERLGQDAGVLDQIRNVEHEAATPGLAMQHSQPMGQT